MDKTRLLDQDQTDYSITAIEVSNEKALENFITFWIRPGHEDTLLANIGDKLWTNPRDRHKHDPSVFHTDDHDSTWSITRHHYHIPYDHVPTKEDLLNLIQLIKTVKDKLYIGPKLCTYAKKY